MEKSESTEELFKIMNLQKARIRSLEEEACRTNKEFENIVNTKPEKSPRFVSKYQIKDEGTLETISRIFNTLEVWTNSQECDHKNRINELEKQMEQTDILISKVKQEINTRKIYGKRPPARLRNKLKEFNEKFKHKI